MVKSGTRWQIGEGNKINVWGDPWLRKSDDQYIKSPMIAGMEHLRVCDLIDQPTRTWRADFIAECFQPDDVTSILSIPFTNGGREDHLIWTPSKTGEYTARSGYHKLMEDILANSELKVDGEWNKLWRAKVPQKCKLLVWRALRNILPTRKDLRRKGVECPVTCPHCDNFEENTWHAFFGCQKALDCWKASGLWEVIQDDWQRAEGFIEFTFHLLSRLTGDKLGNFFMLFWCIWRRRNDKVWKNLEVPAATAVKLGREYEASWKQVRSRDIDKGWHISNEVDLIWKKPEVGRMKCNSDAALFAEDDIFGVGVCVRNDQGEFVIAKTLWFPGSPTPKEAEVIALLEAIKCVKDASFNSMQFELDCKGVVEDINARQSFNNELGTVLQSCKDHLESLQNYEVSFIRRQTNFVAHSLAKASKFYASSSLFNSIPLCIAGLLLNEMK